MAPTRGSPGTCEVPSSTGYAKFLRKVEGHRASLPCGRSHSNCAARCPPTLPATRCSQCCLSGFFKTRTAFWISSTALCSRWRRTAAAMRLKSYGRYFGSGDRCGQWLRTIKPWCWPSRRRLSSLSTTPPRRRTVSATNSPWPGAMRTVALRMLRTRGTTPSKPSSTFSSRW